MFSVPEIKARILLCKKLQVVERTCQHGEPERRPRSPASDHSLRQLTAALQHVGKPVSNATSPVGKPRKYLVVLYMWKLSLANAFVFLTFCVTTCLESLEMSGILTPVLFLFMISV